MHVSILWQIYQVSFGKPIGQELVIEVDFLGLNPKDGTHLESLYLLSKEGLGRSVLAEYQTQRQALSRFFIGAMVLSDSVLAVIRRELRRLSPDVKIDAAEIKTVLLQEVLKREVVEGEQAEEARRKIARIAKVTQKRVPKPPDAAAEVAEDASPQDAMVPSELAVTAAAPDDSEGTDASEPPSEASPSVPV
jgi:hypothetical protein